MNILAPVRDYIEALVHPAAQDDALTAARHRAFIAPRLLGSFAALAAFPLYITMRGFPSAMEVLVFAWLVAPILIAYFLSRTGFYESAHVLSSLALTGLVTAVASQTGGIGSFAAIWLVVVPLEAALSASRRVVATACSIVLAAAGFLLLLDAIGALPPQDALENSQGALAALGIVSAALYATGLALGSESLAQTSFWLLYAEEDRYRLLARNMTDVIMRHGRNGAVIFVSPAAESLFAIKADKLLGHGLFDRIHVADRPAYLTAIADAATSNESRSVEFRIRRERADRGGHGEFVWVEMRCRPMERAAAAEPAADNREVVSVLRDITKRKAWEEALQGARAESERANEAKTRFVATMSHELRTPLNVIIGFSEMLSKEASLMLDAPRREEYAQLINESGRHLLSVVNGILDMSKIETGNFDITPEPFDPKPLVANCCNLLALKADQAGVVLTTHVSNVLPEVFADKRAVSQILLNLVSNAIRFTDRGGQVTVTAGALGSWLELTVEDTGVGIDEADLPRIGDPFFQGRATFDRRRDGTGLGVSIVKGLLALHGGDLHIWSRRGVGTKVTARLPLNCERDRKLSVPGPATHFPADLPVKKIA